MRKIYFILLLGIGFVFSGAAQPTDRLVASPTLLDREKGFGGIVFGTPTEQVSGLVHSASGIGKRWRTTKLFHRPADTITVSGYAVAPTYWFRNNRFIGASISFTPAQATNVAAFLKRKYGPSQRDSTTTETEYWLGSSTYILFEHFYPKARTWELNISSLAMLNEQVLETAVRRQAHAILGWQPDSTGLVHQYPR